MRFRLNNSHTFKIVSVPLLSITLILIANSQSINRDSKIIVKEYDALTAATNAGTESTKLSSIINDGATFKMLYIDNVYNIIGIGWEDREKFGIGKNKNDSAMAVIAIRYGYKSIDSVNKEFYRAILAGHHLDDIPEPLEADGNFQDGKGYMSLDLPGKWFELIRWPKNSKLPRVYFGWGRMSMKILKDNPPVTLFNEGIKCLFKGKEYIYQKDHWQEITRH